MFMTNKDRRYIQNELLELTANIGVIKDSFAMLLSLTNTDLLKDVSEKTYNDYRECKKDMAKKTQKALDDAIVHKESLKIGKMSKRKRLKRVNRHQGELLWRFLAKSTEDIISLEDDNQRLREIIRELRAEDEGNSEAADTEQKTVGKEEQ